MCTRAPAHAHLHALPARPQGTNFNACTGTVPQQLPASECVPPPALVFAATPTPVASAPALECTPLVLRSFQAATRGLSPEAAAAVVEGFSLPTPPGAVLAGPGLTRFSGCTCVGGSSLQHTAEGGLECVVTRSRRTLMSAHVDSSDTRWIIAIVLVAVVPQLIWALVVILLWRCGAAAANCCNLLQTTLLLMWPPLE